MPTAECSQARWVEMPIGLLFSPATGSPCLGLARDECYKGSNTLEKLTKIFVWSQRNCNIQV